MPTTQALTKASTKSTAKAKATAKAVAKGSAKATAKAVAKGSPKAKAKAVAKGSTKGTAKIQDKIKLLAKGTAGKYEEVAKNFQGSRDEWIASEARKNLIAEMTPAEIRRRRFEGYRPDLFQTSA